MNLKPAMIVVSALALVTTAVVLYAKKKDDELDVEMQKVRDFDKNLLNNMKPANV